MLNVWNLCFYCRIPRNFLPSPEIISEAVSELDKMNLEVNKVNLVDNELVHDTDIEKVASEIISEVISKSNDETDEQSMDMEMDIFEDIKATMVGNELIFESELEEVAFEVISEIISGVIFEVTSEVISEVNDEGNNEIKEKHMNAVIPELNEMIFGDKKGTLVRSELMLGTKVKDIASKVISEVKDEGKNGINEKQMWIESPAITELNEITFEVKKKTLEINESEDEEMTSKVISDATDEGKNEINEKQIWVEAPLSTEVIEVKNATMEINESKVEDISSKVISEVNDEGKDGINEKEMWVEAPLVTKLNEITFEVEKKTLEVNESEDEEMNSDVKISNEVTETDAPEVVVENDATFRN